MTPRRNHRNHKNHRNHRLLLAMAFLMTPPGCRSSPDAAASGLPGGATNAAGAAVAPRPTFDAPVPASFQLKNGLRVWLISSKMVPLVNLSLVIRSGSSWDPPGKEGLAALTADMLDEGAGKRGPLEIADEIDFLGAELSVDAQKEHIAISLEVLRRNLDPALEIFADLALRPAFSPGEWERVKDLALNDIVQRREEPREVARVVAERVFYGDDHPYGHPVDGYEASAKKIDLQDVKEFYASSGRPDRAVLLAAGDITLEELRERVESRFGSWKADGPPPAAARKPSGAPAASPGRLVVVDKPGAPQTEMRIVLPGPDFASPSVAPLTLANTILGGTFTSRLVTNLRERNGFTYGASSMMALRGLPSHVVAGSAVHSDKTGPALGEFCREIRAMETGKLGPEELAKSRSTHGSRLVEALEAQDSTLGVYLLSASLGSNPDERREYFRRLGSASAEDIARECRNAYRWDRATIVLVGDRKTIEAQLADLKATPPLDLEGKPCSFPPPELRGREGEPLAP